MEEKQALWDINEFAGVSIRMRKSDGYLNAKDMCKINKKKLWHDYFRLKQTTEYIEALEKKLSNSAKRHPLAQIIESITTGANENRGTWIHPRIATHFAMWISPGFSVEVSGWVEEWKAFSEENNRKYFEELCNLKPFRSSQKEKEIQLQLKQQHNGRIEIESLYGYIDLMYSDGLNKYIVEIKEAMKWKHALDQILCYGNEYPSYKKVIVLFNEVSNLKEIKDIYEKFNIELRIF